MKGKTHDDSGLPIGDETAEDRLPMRRMRGAALAVTAVVLTALMVRSGHALTKALPEKIPVTVTADKLNYDRTTDIYVASGHVKIEQQDIRLEANRVVLNNKTGEAEAEGNVYLQDKEDVVRADKLTVNLNTREGVIYKGDLFMKKENYHLKGDVIERRSASVYRVEHGEFTTCDAGDWFIRANELNIDMNRYATGRGVSLNMAGVPVLYTPYFLFPVRRQSGLLMPQVGYSSKDGFFAENALFWAISDYRDMTFYSDYRARTGHGTGIEYRYNNSRESSGQVFTKFWDMYHTSESRWEFQLEHQEEFAEDLSARADINLVSDEHYYYDLDNSLEKRSKPYIDSNAFYVERWNTAALYLLGQYSTDLTRPNDNTVQKLPELRYEIFEEPVAGPVHLNFEGSAVNFYREAKDGVRRVDFNPQLTAAIGSHGLSLTPRAGARATYYDRSADSVEPTERKYFYSGVDLNARLSRVYGSDGEVGIGRIRHSIEPTISYTYIPHIDQANIPQFDAVDTVLAQNMTTFSIINRLTAHYKESRESAKYRTYDLMVFRLSQSYDVGRASSNTAASHTRSDILGELYLRTPKTFSLWGNGTYDTYSRNLASHSVGLTYAADRFSLNVTERYLRQPATQFLIGGGDVKVGNWILGGQWWRDVENKKTTQEEYRAHYGSQCWGIGFSYVIKPGETRFMAMLDLRGIGGQEGYGKQ